MGGNALDVLPVGTDAAEPRRTPRRAQLAKLIEELRNEYDYVILDCPPIEIVTDADLIAPLADITVFIVRAGLLERSMLPQIDKYYQAKRYNDMAILLNGTDSTGRYGYKYGYKYGYGRYGSYGHYGHYGSYGSQGDEDDA